MTSPTPPDPLAAHERFNVENARRVKHKSVHETVMLAIIDRLTASAEQVRRETRTAALQEAAILCGGLSANYEYRAGLLKENPTAAAKCIAQWQASKSCAEAIRALITPQKEHGK